MKVIYLVRHGQASFGEDDYDRLSPLGHEQSEVLGAQVLRHKTFDSIQAGTMKRHHQTALNSGVITDHSLLAQDDQWNEYDHQAIIAAAHPGLETGTQMKAYLNTVDTPNVEMAEIFKRSITRWVGGQHNADYAETWLEFKRRVTQALDNTIQQTQSRSVVFTSGGPIAYTAGLLLGLTDAHCLKLNWSLVNTGVTKLLVSDQSIRVSSVNEHSFLDTETNKHLITYK